MEREKAISFRNRFREARAGVETGDTDCMAIVHVLEDFGQVLTGKGKTLESYQKHVTNFVNTSLPPSKLSDDYHIQFNKLFRIVRHSRNRAAHEGARSRYFAPRLVELSLRIEDALMASAKPDRLKDFMVSSPVVAYTWEPISIIRKAMLSNSFTHIPYYSAEKWSVVSDSDIAHFLRRDGGYKSSNLNCTLKEALENGMSQSEQPIVASPNCLVADVLKQMGKPTSLQSLPILITHPDCTEHLMGILTYTDLM